MGHELARDTTGAGQAAEERDDPMASVADAADPVATMMQLVTGYQVSQAVYVIAELDVATILHQSGPQTVAELARRTSADPNALRRLIRTLAPLGVFSTNGDTVSITPVGATLSSAHPHSVQAMTRMFMQINYLPFSELLHCVRAGEPAATKYLGEPFFEWLARDAAKQELFSRSMAESLTSLRAGVFDGYQLPAGATVADVGGANGHVLIDLLSRDGGGSRRGIVFDRPSAVPHAESNVRAAGLSDRIDVVSGDFFVAVPSADVYLLGFIVHDWDDEHSLRILESIATAADSGARVLIIEAVIPPGDEPHMSKTIDLTMLGLVTGRERTESEYRQLLDDAGFTLDRVVATPSPFSILEATRR